MLAVARLSVVLMGLLVASLAIAGCASAGEDAEDHDGELLSTEAEVRASCSNPRKYFAMRGDRRCDPIAGKGGQWHPEPLFVDAPAELRAGVCTYRWSSTTSSTPDRAALVSHSFPFDGLAPACGDGSEVSVGTLDPPVPFVEGLGHGGSVGCDVCGIIRDRRLWVIVPPGETSGRRVVVGLSTGERQAFAIKAAPDARALTLTLPPPPRGTTYTQDGVSVL